MLLVARPSQHDSIQVFCACLISFVITQFVTDTTYLCQALKAALASDGVILPHG